MLPIDLPPPPPPGPPLARVDTLITAERVPSASASRMGLVGLHQLHQVSPHWAVGPAVLAPVSGERGGFFGWGLSNLWRWETGAWGAEAAFFAGGGGGSPAWVGGGLMLRSHLAATRAVGPLRLGLGVSQLRFPNGGVGGSQPFASLAWTGLRFHGAPGGEAPLPDGPAVALATETSAVAARYTMRGGSVRRDGTGNGPPLQVAGLAFRRALPGFTDSSLRPYWHLSATGSLSAAYPGHAELSGGLGLHWPLPAWPALGLRAEAALGSGGGGAALDTGGGLLRKLGAGLSWQPTPALGINLLAGLADSPGRFQAREARLELAWRGWDWLPLAGPAAGRSASSVSGWSRASGASDTPGLSGAAGVSEPSSGPVGATLAEASPAPRWTPWAAGIGFAHYPRMRRDGGAEPSLGVAALSLERTLDPAWRLVARAHIATHGQAGGYATGQLGLAWLAPPIAGSAWRLGAEATLGAAGGGAVRVVGGVSGQAQWVGRVELTPALALQVDAGWLRSRSGALSSPVLGLSLVHAFSRLEGR